MINHRFPYPFIPVSGDVIDANSTKLKFSDLRSLAGSVSVGIYDAETQYVATGSGRGEKFFIGFSSEHTKDKLDTFMFGATLPKGDHFWRFKGQDVISFEYSDPTNFKNEEWVLGYGGSDDCDLQLPKFECDKTYGVRIKLLGNQVLKHWGSEQSFDIYSDVICCDSDFCTTGCQDTNVDSEWVMTNIASKINTHPYLNQINVKGRVITNDYTAPLTQELNIYRIVVTDDGSNNALGAVQRTVSTGDLVERVNRVGLVSTYEVCSLTAPANFVPEPVFALPDNCDVCPVGSTTIAAKDVYTVVRGISDDTTISTQPQKDGFAAAVAANYAGATAQRFISGGPEMAVVELEFPVGTAAPVPVKADIVMFSRTSSVMCDLADPAAIAWSDVGNAYRVSRTLCITLQRQDCSGADRLAELQLAYKDAPYIKQLNNLAEVTKVAGDGCEDTYQITQYSKGCMTDSCLASDTAVFDVPGSYDGQAWKVIEAAIPVYDPNKKVGLRITASVDPKFVSDCEFTLMDNTQLEPIKMEVSWIVTDTVGEAGSVCDFKILSAKRTKSGNVGRQHGYSVLTQYIKSKAYDVFGSDYQSPVLRRLLDSNLRSQVDRSVHYRIYYLTFKTARGEKNFDQKAEVVEIPFAIPMNRPDKMLKLEQALLAPLSKFGVVLKKRKDGKL